MRAARTASSSPSDLPFKYLGGDVSLDLVNTVDWTASGPADERLSDYRRLIRWAEGARLLSRLDADRLRLAARSRPPAAEAALQEARRLRTVLQRLYRSLAARGQRDAIWSDFNKHLADTLLRLRVAPLPPRPARSSAAEWAWSGRQERLKAILWPVVWSAARLLVSDEALQVRACAGPDCGWMYVDRSRNRLRRWCAMRTCGTAEKSRRRRDKSRARARRT